MGRKSGLRLVLLLLPSLAVAACATTIVPPAAPANPATVAVLDHGRHSTLLMERPDGSMVRYAYGEWDWYALGRTGPVRAIGALFLPSEAALGRKRMPGPLSSRTAREQVREGVEQVLVFQVEAARSERLARRLDALFEAGRDRMVRHPDFDLDFVPIPASYWLGRSSNLVTAEWLGELGCRVENAGALSAWKLQAGAGDG